MTFTYEVTNTGDVTLTDVVVTDDVLCEIGIIPSLAPGVTVTLTQTVTIQANSPIVNVAVVSGEDALGLTVQDDDDATISIVLGQQQGPDEPDEEVAPSGAGGLTAAEDRCEWTGTAPRDDARHRAPDGRRSRALGGAAAGRPGGSIAWAGPPVPATGAGWAGRGRRSPLRPVIGRRRRVWSSRTSRERIGIPPELDLGHTEQVAVGHPAHPPDRLFDAAALLDAPLGDGADHRLHPSGLGS